MSISLSSEQQAWLQAHVERGDFSSVEEAARQLIDERIIERLAEEDDELVWAKPYVDEALIDVARGNVLTREQHETRMDALLSSMNG